MKHELTTQLNRVWSYCSYWQLERPGPCFDTDLFWLKLDPVSVINFIFCKLQTKKSVIKFWF